MTPTTADTDGGVVRIPADLDRPDRILGGLTARQLAILAAGGVAAWTLVGLLEPLVGLPAAAGLAAPWRWRRWHWRWVGATGWRWIGSRWPG